MKKSLRWTLPLFLFLLLAPLTPQIDLAVAHAFYKENSFAHHALFQFFYSYGTWMAWIFAVLCLFYWKRKEARLYLLTFGLGAGLFANGILKQFWERPRPVQTLDFGGFAPYHPFWSPLVETLHEPCRSFPCGHATMGFVFITLCLAGHRLKNRKLFYTGLALSLFFGIGLSLTRLAQGGHYFSDVLASFLLIWFLALFLEYLLYKKQPCIP